MSGLLANLCRYALILARTHIINRFNLSSTSFIIFKIVIISDNRLKVVYGVDDESDVADSSYLIDVNSTHNVLSVIPGDFNGDLTPDFLLVYSLQDAALRRFEVCYGTSLPKRYSCVDLAETSHDDPTVIE